MRASRSWRTKAGLSIAGCVLALPIGEGFLRVFFPQPPSWLAIYRQHPTLPFYSHAPGVRDLIDTGESRWSVCTDDQGFRVGCDSRPPDGRPCALWLGDSFTFGQGVPFEDSFVGRLDLDPASPLHCVNAAVNGYGPIQYRQVLESLLASGPAPKVVLVATFLGNDFVDCIWSKDVPIRDGILGNEGGWKSVFRLHSHLYRLLSAELHKLRSPEVQQNFLDEEMAEPRSWAEGRLQQAEDVYRAEFARVAATCADRGIAMAVLIVPRSTMVQALARGTAKGIDDPSGETLSWKHARAVLDGLGIRVLDLTPILTRYPVREIFFPIDGHFTPKGHALVADTIRREWGDLLQAR